MLHLVDDPAAGAERLVAMRCGDPDPDGDLAEREVADAVHAARVAHPEARAGLGDDASAFAHGERLEGLVLEATHLAAFVEVAHPALERRVAAAGRIGERGLQGLRIKRLGAERERRHVPPQPPATGGMNTTVSPAASGCSHSPKSPLTATRSISTGSVNRWRACSSA